MFMNILNYILISRLLPEKWWQNNFINLESIPAVVYWDCYLYRFPRLTSVLIVIYFLICLNISDLSVDKYFLNANFICPTIIFGSIYSVKLPSFRCKIFMLKTTSKKVSLWLLSYTLSSITTLWTIAKCLTAAVHNTHNKRFVEGLITNTNLFSDLLFTSFLIVPRLLFSVFDILTLKKCIHFKSYILFYQFQLWW